MAAPVRPAPESSAKREAILDAALELFCERTFDGTAVPLIAERAGVGAGTIYRYFDSKEALVNALYRRWKAALGRCLIEGLPEHGSTREVFRHVWRGLWRFASEHPRALAFLETHHHAAYLDAESRGAGADISTGTLALIERGQEKGEIRQGDAGSMIAMVFGAFVGLVKDAGDDGLTYDEQRIAETEESAWGIVRAR